MIRYPIEENNQEERNMIVKYKINLQLNVKSCKEE